MPETEEISVNELVARNMLRLRRHRGWTQAELASRLAVQTQEKWDATMISKTEKHQRKLTLNELVALALVFGVSPVDLLTPEPDEHIKIGDAVMPRDVYLQAVVYFPGIFSKLRRLVAEGKFSGWGTVDRLLDAGFSEWEANLIAGTKFSEWLIGPSEDEGVPPEKRTH